MKLSRQVPCKIDGCASKARQRGRCKKHYRIWRKEYPEPILTREPEYRKEVHLNRYRTAWQTRLNNGSLCEDWKDLESFAYGVYPKPGPSYRLCRIRPKELYGPTNFIWREQVKRIPGESMTDYALRLRVEQLSRFPDFERDRQLMKSFGLTQDQFDQMSKEQNHGCAICTRPETTKNGKSDKPKCLSVDHCHDTGKIRGLLCFDCNVTLGRMGESVERLEAMIRYIKKHAHPAPQLKLVGG